MTRSAAAVAARAFEETLELLHLPEDAPEFRNPAAFGRRAALLVVPETAWGQTLAALYDVEQARAVLGVASRQAVHGLARRQRLLALDGSKGRKLYPAFQFSQTGRPFAAIRKIIGVFDGVVETPYTIASWFVSPQDLLSGRTPAQWLRTGQDPELLLEAARRSAGELAR